MAYSQGHFDWHWPDLRNALSETDLSQGHFEMAQTQGHFAWNGLISGTL